MAGAVKEAVMEVVEKVGGARAGAVMAAVETEAAEVEAALVAPAEARSTTGRQTCPLAWHRHRASAHLPRGRRSHAMMFCLASRSAHCHTGHVMSG